VVLSTIQDEPNLAFLRFKQICWLGLAAGLEVEKQSRQRRGALRSSATVDKGTFPSSRFSLPRREIYGKTFAFVGKNESRMFTLGKHRVNYFGPSQDVPDEWTWDSIAIAAFHHLSRLLRQPTVLDVKRWYESIKAINGVLCRRTTRNKEVRMDVYSSR
jgi:hypothetical protein